LLLAYELAACPQDGLALAATLNMPAGHVVQFADFVPTLGIVCAIVNSSRGDAHLLLFDDALNKPPLMDAMAMPVRALLDPTRIPTPNTTHQPCVAVATNLPQPCNAFNFTGLQPFERILFEHCC
jgi:hypothetical protein